MRLTVILFCISMMLLVPSGARLIENSVHSPSIHVRVSRNDLTVPIKLGQIAPLSLAHNLRTDLRGSSISIELPENAPDKTWDSELMRKFQQMTGIHVQVLRPGNDTTLVLKDYLNQFRAGAPQADVYAIDIVWPGLLAEYAEDLRPAFSELRGVAPVLVKNNVVNGKLVALPYFVEVSLLYYRTDLLSKHGFERPPRTWRELEHQAWVIQEGERAAGNKNFWGFLWQGAASEALTCNALEWQSSQGAGSLVNENGTVDLNRTIAAATWNRALHWIGTISPPSVTNQLEDDSLKMWKESDAAFMRNWPYAYEESRQEASKVRGKVGVTLLPMGEGRRGRHADILGGFQLMLSKRSHKKQEAIELLKFLTSPEIQRLNAVNRGYAPVTMVLYKDPIVLNAAPFFGTLGNILLHGAIARPSTIVGDKYDRISAAFFTSVHNTLTGQMGAASAVDELDRSLKNTLRRAIAH
jgi:trehalose/maltose transport system substrate-binding protein